MAKYGAKYLKWAPITSDTSASALPVYGASMSLGALVKVTDSPSFNEGKIYGDDALKDYINEYKECSIDVEITELATAVASAISGAAISNGEIAYSADDTAPYGGLAFFIKKQIDGVKKYQGIFYPKIKATVQGDEFASKADGITLTGGKVHFVAQAAANGNWKRMSEDFSTEAAAQSWVDSMVGNTTYYAVTVVTNGAGTGESVSPVGTTQVKSGEDFVLTITGTATKLYDNGTDATASISGGTYTISAIAAAHDIAVIF